MTPTATDPTAPGTTDRHVFDNLPNDLTRRFNRTLERLRVDPRDYSLEDTGTAIYDLLTDMMFVADIAGIDFNACLAKAKQLYAVIAVSGDDNYDHGPR